ncbi:hypothetical protein ColKHC_00758 [Colletotrichum higginsianum]|nr:hypothetical protein ColKHC_00758 [Colletotrichum higginsianum]
MDIGDPSPEREYASSSRCRKGRVLRLVLLSPKDISTTATEQRLERFFNLNGGHDAIILFLLNQQGHETNPTVAFMNLQIE